VRASGAETLTNPVGDRGHLELRTGDVLQQVVGPRALTERPELAQQVARVTPGEPLVPELTAQEVPQL